MFPSLQTLFEIKPAEQMFHEQIYNRKKLNELGVRIEYQIEIANRFAALENLSDDDITRAWENIEENIRSSAKHSLGATGIEAA